MEEIIAVKRGWHCTIIENHVISSDISCYAKIIYVVLCTYANRGDKTCYPSLKTICKDTSIKSKTTVKKGINELVNKGFLEIINRKDDKGSNKSNLYIIKDYPIPSNDIGHEVVDPIPQDDIGVGHKMTYPIPRDDHELKPINKNQENYSQKNYIKEQVENIWKEYPLKKGKAAAVKKIPKLIKKYGYEQLQRCIERYIKYVEHRQRTDFKELKFQNGSTFFNGTYEDYLDQNYEGEIDEQTGDSQTITENSAEETEGERLYRIAKEKYGDELVDDIKCDF